MGNVNRAKFKRSTSVTPAMLNVPEHNLREFLGREKLPYMDHYRQSVDLGKYFLVMGWVLTRNSGTWVFEINPRKEENSK